MDQLQIDTMIKQIYPTAFVGQKFVFGGRTYTYKGTDIIADQIDDLTRDFPDIIDTRNARTMLMNPIGFTPRPFQLDPSIRAALTGNIAGAVAGEFGSMLTKEIANGALGDSLSGQAKDILGGLAGAGAGAAIGGALGGRVGAIAGGLAGAMSGGLGGALGNLAGNFLPPGLDGPVQAIKGAISGVTKQLPFKAAGAADIVNQIATVKVLLNVAVKGPSSLIFAAVGKNLLSDIPGADALKSVVNLQTQVAGLARLASNPVAFAAQAALMQRQFPMINMNKLAAKMLAGAALGALGGKGFNINAMVPNMALAAGVMKMLPIPGKTPALDALKPRKTPPPPKPVKPVQLKNLFAESAAGSAMSTLTQPLSSFMGMMSTVAPAALMVADSAPKTSFGNQKLVGNANTVNWGSGGYGRNTALVKKEEQRTKLTGLIERHTAELLNSVDYSKLTKYSYPDLIKKYPRIKPTMTVIEALAIIEETDRAANTVTTTT